MGPQRMYSVTVWVRRLLVANLLVFLIQKTLLIDTKYVAAFAFDPMLAWQQPWTFLTYMFLLFYLLCGLGGATLSFLLTQWAPVGTIVGASGAIMGVAVAFAWYWPNYPVFVFPLPDPIPAKWLITFLVGLDLALAWAGALTRPGLGNGVAHLAHLGGVGAALVYLKALDWQATHRERRGGPMAESSVLVSQPPRANRGGAVPPSAKQTKRSAPDARAAAEIDRVLDKINATGMDSLTPAERKFLTEISRRKRTPPKG